MSPRDHDSFPEQRLTVDRKYQEAEAAGAGGAAQRSGLHAPWLPTGPLIRPGLAHQALGQFSGRNQPGILPAHFMVFGFR